MIKVGDPIRFILDLNYGQQKSYKAVTGRIIYINHRHRYFVIEYDTRGGKMRQCHKFAEGIERDYSHADPGQPRQIQSKHGCAIF